MNGMEAMGVGDWVAIANMGLTAAGLVAIAAIANYRIGQLEQGKKSSDEAREKAFNALGEALAAINATIAEKSEKAAADHARYDARLDEHGRRLDEHGRRIIVLETKVGA